MYMQNGLPHLSVIDWISILGTVITCIGFGITLYQIWGVKKQVTAAAAEARAQVQSTLNLVTVTETVQKIEHLQTQLMNHNWWLALTLMTEINKAIIVSAYKEFLICTDIAFENALKKLPTDLCYLRDIASQEEKNTDARFVRNNLQVIQDNLKKIETHLKK